jgi:hypothetical protein
MFPRLDFTFLFGMLRKGGKSDFDKKQQSLDRFFVFLSLYIFHE